MISKQFIRLSSYFTSIKDGKKRKKKRLGELSTGLSLFILFLIRKEKKGTKILTQPI